MSIETQTLDEPTCPVPKKGFLARLGPGLITGASDDDPSGIGTYSQAGAQYGYGLLWTMLFSLPLMASIQEISARIGRITGRGLAGNIRRHYPAYADRIISIGGSPRGKFLRVYIALSDHGDTHKVYVPTGR